MNALRVLAWVVVAGCHPPSVESVGALPPVKGQVLVTPVRTEASSPHPPKWPEVPAGEGRLFTGEGSGPDLESARASAERDMLVAVAAFLGTDISVRESDVQVSSGAGDTQLISSTVGTRVSVDLAGLRARWSYWERWAMPLLPQDPSFRVQVAAPVSTRQLRHASARRAAARREAGLAPTLAVLPPQPLGGTPSPGMASGAWPAALGMRLSRRGWRVLGAAQVGAAAGNLAGAAAVSRVEQLLMPDYVLRSVYRVEAARYRLTAQLVEATSGTALQVVSVAGPVGELERSFEQVATELNPAPAVQGDVGSRPASERSTASLLSTARRLSDASEALARGKIDLAITLAGEAAAADPSSPQSHLLLGRIFERAGQLGNVYVPTPADSRATPPAIAPWELCGVEVPHREGPQPPSPNPPAPPPDVEGPDLDVVLGLVAMSLELQLRGYGASLPPARAPTAGAIDAYWQAFLSAQRADPDLAVEAAIALANLGRQAARTELAAAIFEVAAGLAESPYRPHLRSLALLGQGQLARGRGDLSAAIRLMRQARRERELAGGKSYLLEIDSELGGVYLQRGDTALARHHFAMAGRLAQELNNRYLTATLDNNTGVLALARGRASEAGRSLVRAERALIDLNAAQGAASAGLNLGWVQALRGETEQAAVVFNRAEGHLRAGSGEVLRAELHARRGYLHLRAGAPRAAERELVRSFVLYRQLARRGDDLRAWGNLVVRALRDEPGAETLACAKEAYLRRRIPVFAQVGAQRYQTLPTLAPGTLSPTELAAALTASSLIALSGHEPAHRPGPLVVPSSPRVPRRDGEMGELAAALRVAVQDWREAPLRALPPPDLPSHHEGRPFPKHSSPEALQLLESLGETEVTLDQLRQLERWTRGDAFARRHWRRAMQWVAYLWLQRDVESKANEAWLRFLEVFPRNTLLEIDWPAPRQLAHFARLAYSRRFNAPYPKDEELLGFVSMSAEEELGPSIRGWLEAMARYLEATVTQEGLSGAREELRHAKREYQHWFDKFYFRYEAYKDLVHYLQRAKRVLEITHGPPTEQAPVPVSATPLAAIEYRKSARYDRTLDAMVAPTQLYLYLTPNVIDAGLQGAPDAALEQITAVIRHAEALERARLLAAAHLNRGALYWHEGAGDEAVGDFVAAHRAAVRSGDIDAVGHAHAWFARVFEKMGDEERAAEHHAVARAVAALDANP